MDEAVGTPSFCAVDQGEGPSLSFGHYVHFFSKYSGFDAKSSKACVSKPESQMSPCLHDNDSLADSP